MSGMEWNKIVAAVLVAGLVASLSGFVSKKLVHPETPETRAYAVEGVGAPAATIAEAPKGPEDISALLASADLAAGEKQTRVCASCHSFDKGGPNKVGPNLWGIVGAKHAHVDGFAYSPAMTALSDKAWSTDDLNAFLYNPKAAISGTKMVFGGIKNTQDRANLIAYLKSLK